MVETSLVAWSKENIQPDSIPVGRYTYIDGVKIHYLEKGEGHPLFLIHGLGAYSYTWRYNIDQLATNYRVIAPDLKGFGLSDKPRRTGYSVDDHVFLMKKFIQKMAGDHVFFVGSSMGGEIGLRLCLDEPELIDKLVLIGSSGYRDKIPWYLRALGYLPYQYLVKPIIKKRLLKEEKLGQIVKDAFYNPTKINQQEIKNYLYPVFSNGFQEAFFRMLRNFDFGKRLNDYPNIKQSALIIAGEHDQVIPIDHLKRLHQDLPNSHLIMIEKVGHFLHEEKPEEVNRLILEFLSDDEF